MNVDENVEWIIKLTSPFLLVGSPIALLALAFAKEGPVPVNKLKLIFVVLMCVAGFFMGLYGCWRYLGWFQKKE